ncbi:DUF934 domain-containing protein [Pseudooceanicola sp. C21-150M6]|uniref:DUF934 domain-containing protein n=1 Tax=Pseudooceanicola sp. C21-150M6 TaxID=3434355 RepID=UPI003D7F4D17
MTVIVTDTGFSSDDWAADLADSEILELASDTDVADLTPAASIRLVRVAFPAFSDGRGFSIAAALRRHGYTGPLRAVGHVLSDQYAMARRSGFDEVEISDELAARQPEGEWQFRSNWQAFDYRARLQAG